MNKFAKKFWVYQYLNSVVPSQISGGIQLQWIYFQEVASHSQLKTCGIQPSQTSYYANNLHSSRKLMEKSLRIALESLSSHPAMIHRTIITYLRPPVLNLVTICLLFLDRILLACLLLFIWARSGIMLKTLSKRRSNHFPCYFSPN